MDSEDDQTDGGLCSKEQCFIRQKYKVTHISAQYPQNISYSHKMVDLGVHVSSNKKKAVGMLSL
jgi:hypothetical protein